MKDFFEIAERSYEHFSFDAAARETARALIFAVLIGILLAALYSFYQRRVPGALVRAILKHGALSEETALDAAALGVRYTALLELELSRNPVLKKLVTVCEREGEPPLFYIKEELRYRAEIRFSEKGNGLSALIVTAVLSTALALLIIRALPAFLTVIDRMMG